MTNTPFTARNVAKFLVQSVVADRVATLSHTYIIDHTEIQEDNIAVDLGSKVFGWGVSSKLKPYTDQAIDKTADFIVTKREARKAKKNAKQEEK